MRSGISMMGRGADIDPETLEARKKMILELQKDSIQPQKPELSWTQGAARLAEALSAAYQAKKLKEDTGLYKQQKTQELQNLASYLTGKESAPLDITQFKNPETQKLALGYAIDERKYDRERRAKADDLRIARESDPIKKGQDEIYRLNEVMNDPEAPDNVKKEAQLRLKKTQETLAAMTPSKTTINIDTAQKAEGAGDIKYKEKKGEKAAEREQAYNEVAMSASDNRFRMQDLRTAIEEGKLTNQNTTNVGQALNIVGARLGIPNESAAIANYIQTANQQLVDARKSLKGQGQISDRETLMLAKTQLLETDTIESMLAKVAVFDQVYKRQEDIAKLANEWEQRYGGTHKNAPNGMSFDATVQKYIQKNPLVSYEEILKRNAEAASKANAMRAQQ